MYPYPTMLPSEEANLLLGYLRGTPPSASETAHAVWALTGYGLSQVLPTQVFGIAAELSRDEAIHCLEVIAGESIMPQASIPWDRLLPFLALLLQEFLKRKQGG